VNTQQNMEQLHAQLSSGYDWDLRPPNMAQKLQTNAQHRNCESDYTQWSSLADTSHIVNMDVLHTGSISMPSCALQDTWDMT